MKIFYALCLLLVTACQTLPAARPEHRTASKSSALGSTNLMAWQSFLLSASTNSDEQRQQKLAVLDMRVPADRLRKLIIESNAADTGEAIKANNLLLAKTTQLHEPLRSLLLLYAQQNQKLLAKELTTQLAAEETSALQTQVRQLEKQLKQSRAKIAALTAIEQQINDVKTTPDDSKERISDDDAR